MEDVDECRIVWNADDSLPSVTFEAAMSGKEAVGVGDCAEECEAVSDGYSEAEDTVSGVGVCCKCSNETLEVDVVMRSMI